MSETQQTANPSPSPTSSQRINGATIAGSCAFIDDGYTERGYFREVSGHYPEIRLEYRPLLVAERTDAFDASDKLTPREGQIAAAEIMANRIKWWDLKDRNGNSVPITSETLQKVKPNLFENLWALIAGVSPSAIDPTWEELDKKQHVQDRLKAIAGGTDIGAVKETQNLKN
jgi:hypothetical protein